MRRLLLFCVCLVCGRLLVAQNCSSFSLTVSLTDTAICTGQSVNLNANATISNPWYPINLQPYYNANWDSSLNPNAMVIPVGNTVLGGVPFTLAPCSHCYNSWNAFYLYGTNPLILAFPLNKMVDSLFSLINTYGGVTGGPYAAIQLVSNGQIVYQQDLYAGTDIRDFNQGGWVNTINGTSTINVYMEPFAQHRLDMVIIGLPANLVHTVIDSILYVDNGSNSFQRMAVTGVTVKTDTSINTGISYLWSTGDTASAISVSPLQNTVYSVSAIIDGSGCLDSATIHVNIDSLPPVVVHADPTVICSNDSTAVCTPAGYSLYQWNVPGAPNSNCIEATQAGNYYVTVTNSSGCTGQSNHLPVSVYPVPSVSIVVQGDTLASYGQSNYQWILNNDPIAGATGSVYVAKQRGEYAVQVTDSNGCTTISTPVLVATGIQNLVEESVSIYPNPSTGNWQLTVDNTLIGSTLQIFDEQGRLVFQSKISLLKSKIDLDIASGVYYLRIISDKYIVTRKLVKTNSQ